MYKIVGIDEESRFPTRVEDRLSDEFVGMPVVTTGRLSEPELDNRYLGKEIDVMKNGAIGNGIADDTAIVNSIIANAPASSAIRFPEGKTFKINGSILNVGKSIDIVAHGAKFIQGSTKPVIDFSGSFVSSVAVTAISPVTIDAGVAANIPGMSVTVAAAFPVKTGDVVKIYSKDVLVGTELDVSPAPAAQYRAGQFGTVHSVAGNVIVISGAMRDPMTTGIRITKLNPITTRLYGGEFVGSLDSPSSLIRNALMVRPVIRDVKIAQSGGQAISMHGNYGYLIDNIETDFSLNLPGSGFYGYGIDDNTNEFGVFSNSHINMPRHGYSSTVSTTVVADDVPSRHGRTYGTRIDNVTVSGSTSTAFDTHSNGEEISFSNCHAVDCYAGYALRGRNNHIYNCSGANLRQGFRIFSDSAAGESYGHTIEGLSFEGITDYVGEFAVRFGATHPNANVLDRRPIHVNGIYAQDVTGLGITARNVTVLGDNIFVKFAGDVAGKTFNNIRNSHFRIGKFLNDFYSTSGSGGALMVAQDADCILESDSFRVTGASTLPTRLVNGIQTSGNPTLRVRDFAWDYLPSNGDLVFGATTAGGYCDYRGVVGSATGKTNFYRGAGITDAALMRKVIAFTLHDEIAIVSTATGTNQFVDPPAGRNGQILRIMNRASGATVNVVTSSNINNTNNGTLGIPAWSTVSYMYEGGLWRQI